MTENLYQIIRTDEHGNQHLIAKDLSISEAQEYYRNIQMMNIQLSNQNYGLHQQAQLQAFRGGVGQFYPPPQQTITQRFLIPTHDIVYQGKAPAMENVITMGELEGWRLWTVTHEGEFQSLTRIYVWENGEAEGFPTDYGHEGVYCFNSREEAVTAFEEARGNVAIGRVALRGTVIEHSRGYRAEFAKIVEIVGIKGHFWPKKKYHKLLNIDPDLPRVGNIINLRKAKALAIFSFLMALSFTLLSLSLLIMTMVRS